jgi:hypothetical protein
MFLLDLLRRLVNQAKTVRFFLVYRKIFFECSIDLANVFLMKSFSFF